MYNNKYIILFLSFFIVSCNKSPSNSNSTSTTYIPSHMLTYENSDCSGTATEINGMCGPNEEGEVGFEAFGCLFIEAESECVAMDICIYMNYSVLMSGYSMTLNNDGTVISTIPGGCNGGGFAANESQSQCEDENGVWEEATSVSGTWTETSNTVTITLTSDNSEIDDDEMLSFVRSGNNLIAMDVDWLFDDGESDSCTGFVYIPQ